MFRLMKPLVSKWYGFRYGSSARRYIQTINPVISQFLGVPQLQFEYHFEAPRKEVIESKDFRGELHIVASYKTIGERNHVMFHGCPEISTTTHELIHGYYNRIYDSHQKELARITQVNAELNNRVPDYGLVSEVLNEALLYRVVNETLAYSSARLMRIDLEKAFNSQEDLGYFVRTLTYQPRSSYQSSTVEDIATLLDKSFKFFNPDTWLWTPQKVEQIHIENGPESLQSEINRRQIDAYTFAANVGDNALYFEDAKPAVDVSVVQHRGGEISIGIIVSNESDIERETLQRFRECFFQDVEDSGTWMLKNGARHLGVVRRDIVDVVEAELEAMGVPQR